MVCCGIVLWLLLLIMWMIMVLVEVMKGLGWKLRWLMGYFGMLCMVKMVL